MTRLATQIIRPTARLTSPLAAASLLVVVTVAALPAYAADASPAAPNAAVAGPPPAAAAAATTASPTAQSKFAEMPIRRSAPADGPSGVSTPTAPKPSNTGPDLVRVGFALTVVIGLIFLLRWGSRRLFQAPNAARSSQAIRVLSRTPLSPKQQVVLLQVGKRLLVVADGGTQASALGQITDPDEVAALIGQVRAEHQSAASKTFGSLFGRVTSGFRGATGEAEQDVAAAEAAIRDGYANDNGSPGRSYDAAPEDERVEDADDVDDRRDTPFEAADEPAEPRRRPVSREPAVAGDSNVVAATQEELAGLMDKVRLLSKQFGRG